MVKKKVVIVGGSPAGMQAALTSIERGYEVVLLEKESKLGGTLNHATDLEFKKDLRNYLDWIVAQTLKSTATIKLNTEATKEVIKAENPDALIIAVGATPLIPSIKGVEQSHVHWAGDIDCGRVPVGQKVIIVGGGLTGAESAVDLAMKGKDVTLLEMQGLEALLNGNGAALINKLSLQSLLMKHGVKVVTNTKLEEITKRGIKTINSKFQWQ